MIRWVSFGTSAMPRLPPLADHEDQVEFDDGFASFVEPARPDPDESEAGPTMGFADLRDSGLRVQRVPVEDRAREADVLQADLEPVPARRVDEKACRDGDGQESVHDPSPEERFPREHPAGVVLVEVDLVPVPGQQGEPHIVRLRDGAPDLAAHLGPDPEVLEERPVLVHATLGERGSRNVMNVVGRLVSSARALPNAPAQRLVARPPPPPEERVESILNTRRTRNRMKEGNSVLR